ncbi:hypothetical protein [Paenibacillus xylanexedens]|uniref:Uncharacterized protein n=1 Tax=Paenibacillus xylanexedens TaxID=528191 RepID=A0ABS4RLU2_PAEXY|nr:hypothetical protein [Paenibacillus xylanexedens]MBP2243865.1 hypothetical protein [Paenibacillus xylanexedens]
MLHVYIPHLPGYIGNVRSDTEEKARCLPVHDRYHRRKPHAGLIAEAQRKITADIYEIRKQFRQRGIKVYEEVADHDGVVARYKCRSYESQMRIGWTMMAADASVVMREYLGLNTERFEGERPFVTVPPKVDSKKTQLRNGLRLSLACVRGKRYDNY